MIERSKEMIFLLILLLILVVIMINEDAPDERKIEAKLKSL